MSKHTPGRWNWHTSNSWRRLYSDQGHGKQVCVLMPTENFGLHMPNNADMSLMAAAPCLLAACKAMLKADSEVRYSAREFVEAKEMMAAAIAMAEGRA